MKVAGKTISPEMTNVVYVVGGVVAIYVAWQLYKGLRGLVQPIANATDATLDGIAGAILRATAGADARIADGIRYVLPNGGTVRADQVTPAAGGKFIYLGKTYALSKALGNGAYEAVLDGGFQYVRAPQKLQAGAVATDELWGPIGSVELRQ